MCGRVNDTIKGAKLLTLYKQHYLNKYLTELECQYSCWGYFDGMDITEVHRAESKLFIKKSNAAVSDTWYQTARKIQRQNGSFSEQVIGLFRCAESEDDTDEDKFWDEESRKAFLAACFVQLGKGADKSVVRKRVDDPDSVAVQVLTYFTFDNADLVVFLQSNSFAAITDKLREIDEDADVVYSHPICGVLEKTLDQMSESDHTPRDMAGNAVVNDDVKELRINIVGDVGKFEKKLRYLLNKVNDEHGLKNYENSTFAYMTGHENYTFFMRETDIYSFLRLLVPKGVLTHNNQIFGEGLYNMETQLIMKEELFSTLSIEEPLVSEDNMAHWCRNKLKTYQEYMEKALQCSDDGIFAYHQSIIKTLNTLVQLEEFELSENIFCIIYPALELFDEQLTETIGECNGIIESLKREKVMETMLDFLDSVNSIIYHAIHMDQVFLMIPGCSGTSFSIPTKLSLFYLWYLECIADILNDSSHKYCYYLTPVMESKPCTYLAEFGLPPGDRLICVKVSQRSLYMPRALFMILTHEMAHYIGDKIRQREERLKCVVRTLGYLLAEAIIPYWETKKDVLNGMEFAEYMAEKKSEAAAFAIESLMHEIGKKVREQGSAQIFHVSQVENLLKEQCAYILADENHKLEVIIKKIPVGLEDMGSTFSEKARLLERFENTTERCQRRRIQNLGSGVFDKIIPALLKEYQEIFADAAAIAAAQFSYDDYLTAFNISEGCVVEESIISQKDLNRRNVIGELYFGMGNSELRRREPERNLVEYWPFLDVVPRNMKRYLEACCESLESQITSKLEKAKQIRRAKDIFSDKSRVCKDIYGFIDEKAQEYGNDVKRKLRVRKEERTNGPDIAK